MTENTDNEEFFEFRGEALEMLDLAESHLLSLEEGQNFKSNYDAVFRVFHSIKGASGMMGLDSIQHLMHHLESLLSKAKDWQELPKELTSYFLTGADSCRTMLKNEDVDFPLLNLDVIISKKENLMDQTVNDNSTAVPQSAQSSQMETDKDMNDQSTPLEWDSSFELSDESRSIENGIWNELELIFFQYCDCQDQLEKLKLTAFVQQILKKIVEEKISTEHINKAA